MTDTQSAPALTYVALPPAGQGPGVLVLHAWWGLNDYFRSVCDRLAAAGFVAAAPDLYDGQVATTPDEADRLRLAPKRQPAEETVARAVEELKAHPAVTGGSIGVIGFSMGGAHALELAQQPGLPISTTVIFYEAWPADYSQGQSVFQCHYAETDEYVAGEDREAFKHALEQSGRSAEFYIYPGTTHWFVEADRPDAYVPGAAELAWERAIDFLHRHLGQ